MNGVKSNILEVPWLKRAIKLRAFQLFFLVPTIFLFVVVILQGLWGVQDPLRSWGLLVTWILWWGILIVSTVVFGRVWCHMCPFGGIGAWINNKSFGLAHKMTGFSLNRKWPKRLSNLWVANIFFLGFFTYDNVVGISNNPLYTAYFMLFITAVAILIAVTFQRRAFCRYVCPLTSFLGIPARGSILELRAADRGRCKECTYKACYAGSTARSLEAGGKEGYPCPVFEFPGKDMDSNTYCILCTECVKSCPYDNIKIGFRSPGKDIWKTSNKRFDEAWFALALISIVSVGKALLVANGRVDLVTDYGQFWVDIGLGATISKVILLLTGLALGFGLMYGFALLARFVVGNRELASGGRSSITGFITQYSYALAPLAMLLLLADLLEHLLRNVSTFTDATGEMLRNFPYGFPDELSASALLGEDPIKGISMGLILLGYVFTLFMVYKISFGIFKDKGARFRSFLCMAGATLSFTCVGVWLVYAPVLY